LLSEKQSSLQCERNKQIIQTAMNNINIDINNATYEDISNKFQKEFSKKDIYEPLLVEKYDNVEARTGGYYSEFEFSSNIAGGVMVKALYEFQKKGEDNKNSFWRTGACTIFIDKNGKIMN